mgnify:CR=1 FL=1
MVCNLDGITGKGRCCCNCEHQMLAMKHPWNAGKAQGRITEIFGALCAVPDMMSAEGRRQAVFFETGHGMCEMHDFRAPSVVDQKQAAVIDKAICHPLVRSKTPNAELTGQGGANGA